MSREFDDEQVKDVAAAYCLLDRLIKNKIEENGEDSRTALYKAARLLGEPLKAHNVLDQWGNVLEEYQREDHGRVGDFQI